MGWIPATEESWVVKSLNVYTRNYPDGRTETFDTQGRLTSVADAVGTLTTLVYDGSGRLWKIHDEGGRELIFGYSGSSTLVETLTGPGNTAVATYTYYPSSHPSSGRLWTVTYADGDLDGLPDGVFTFVYDGSSHLLTDIWDRENRLVEHHTYATNFKGLTSELADGVERYTLSYEVDRTEVTDALGNETVYHHRNVAGIDRITEISGPCVSCGGGQESQTWEYDDDGRVKEHTDGEGFVTSYKYFPNGRLEKETRRPVPGNTHETWYTYYPDAPPGRGRLHTRTEPNGAVTTFTYVDAGPSVITEAVSPPAPPRRTEIQYTPQGKPQFIEDPRQKVWELSFMPQGDLEWIKDPTPQHHQTTFEYDPMGRLKKVVPPATTPAIAPPITTYDTLGRVKRITNTDGSGTFTEYTYDGSGRRTRTRDALGTLTDYEYDTYGRLKKVKNLRTGAPTIETEYGYDVMSRLWFIQDARGKRTTFEYDNYNRVEKVNYPGTPSPFELYTYDGTGRVATRRDRKNILTTFSYDGLGRLTLKDYSDATPNAVFQYDQGPAAHKGRMTSAANGTATLSWTYDLAGQVLSEVATRAAGPASTVAYTYDPAGNRETLSLDGTQILRYTYDDRGLPELIRRLPLGSADFTMSHDAASRPTALTFPTTLPQTRTDYTYDNRSRLSSVTTRKNLALIAQFSYPSYDQANNRLQRVGATAPAETYDYDDLYRLEGVTRGSPSEAYTYDDVGNRRTSIPFPSPPWDYSDRNELLGYGGDISLLYDPNGNLTNKTETTPPDAWTYEWNAENLLTRVTNNSAQVATYNYDPLGRRNQRSLATNLHTYVYDGEDILFQHFTNVIVEEGMVDPPAHLYIHGPGIDEPLAVEHGNGTVGYYHGDGLGSIVRMTDGAGTVKTPRQYDAFGNLEVGANAEGYAYTGREWDPETGLYYYRARYYDPKIGRFISEDPIGFDGGINFYPYVENNPVNWTDPDGLRLRPPLPRPRPRQPAPRIPPRAVDDPTSRPKPTGTWKGQPTYLPDWLNEYLDEIVDEMERARCTPGNTPPDDRCKLAKIKCIDECTWAVGGARWNQGSPFRNCVDRCMKREGC